MGQDFLKKITINAGRHFAKKEENILFNMENINWKIDVIYEYFSKHVLDKDIARKACELSRDMGLDDKVYNLEYWQKLQIDLLCEKTEIKDIYDHLKKVKSEKPKKTTATTVISNSSSSSFGCGDRDSYGCGDSISRKSYSYGCGGSSSKYGC